MQEAKDVVGQYRRLAVFPLLSMLGLMLGFFALTIPAALALGTPGKSIMATLGNGFGLLEGKLTSKTIWFVFPLYFFEYFTVVFFNAALACSALRAFRGEDVSVMAGLRMAAKRIPTLLAWTLVASTVGLVLRLIEERADSVARFFSAILGALWSLTIVLVVPVLAAEELGPAALGSPVQENLGRRRGRQSRRNDGCGTPIVVGGLAACAPVVLPIRQQPAAFDGGSRDLRDHCPRTLRRGQRVRDSFQNHPLFIRHTRPPSGRTRRRRAEGCIPYANSSQCRRVSSGTGDLCRLRFLWWRRCLARRSPRQPGRPRHPGRLGSPRHPPLEIHPRSRVTLRGYARTLEHPSRCPLRWSARAPARCPARHARAPWSRGHPDAGIACASLAGGLPRTRAIAESR